MSNTACATPCTFYFIGQKYEDCTACSAGIIGNVGTSPYYHGGQTRSVNPCPYCDGAGKKLVENTIEDSICVIWDYKKWVRIGSVASPEGRVQTICGVDLLENVRNCQYIIFNTDIEKYTRHRFTLDGQPNPCGFGEDAYIISLWEKA